MARLMRNPAFRQWQWDHRFDPHIAPINHYVDTLRKDAGSDSVPYVPPIYGGVEARLLSVMRDPGPKTQDTSGGSGFICMENDDKTAEKICNYFAEVKIQAEDIVPWNAYPWYINRKPTPSELEVGTLPLKTIIDLLPKLCVVMLHGGEAKDLWKRLKRKYPEISRLQELYVIETYHTSPQAFWHKDPLERDRRKTQLADSFKKAGEILQSGKPLALSTTPDLSTIHTTSGVDMRAEPRISDIPVDMIREVKQGGDAVSTYEGQKNQNISEGVRKSWEDPEVRKKRQQHHAVRVHRNSTLVGEFSSLYQAFKILGLPVSRHIPFRIKLKQVGSLPFSFGNDVYDFKILPPL